MEQRAIDTTYLKRCIGTLERALDNLGSRDGDDVVYDLYRTVCVKQFDLVLEQSGKLLRKRLRPWFASNRQADRLTFKDLFRHAAKHGLLPADACERWLTYRDNRNDAAHDEGDGFAKATLKLLPGFIEDATALADVMSSPARAIHDAPPSKAQADGTLHLSARHRATLEALLQEHLPDAEVWAYGSRVNGESHDGSDLDLVLRGPGLAKIDAMRYADFLEAVGESTIPFLVEAHDWARLPETFHRQIERAYVRIAARENENDNSEWDERTWGDLATLEYGRALRGYRSRKGPYRVFGTNGPIGWHTEPLYEGPSVIVGRKGAYRGVHYAPSPFFAIDTAFYLKPKERFEVRWAYYELLTHDINGLDTGSAIPSTRRESFYDLPVRVPPQPEQQEIVHILGTIDDKIELNRRMNETLEAMVRALFKSWFVDFEPVRAQHDGRDTGLPKHLTRIFPDRLVGSPLGDIPAEWRVGTLGDVAVSPGTGVEPAELPGDTPYIGLEHMPRRSVALTDWDSADAVSSRKSAFEKGDILFGKLRPYFHKVGVAPVSGVCSTDILVIRPREPTLSTFVLATVSSPDFVSYTSRTSTGTKMPRTSWKTMSSFRLCVPADGVAMAFFELIEPILGRIVENVCEMRNLAEIRDGLLPKLMS